jgi:hypothetical protein
VEIIASEDFKSCYFRILLSNYKAGDQALAFVTHVPQQQEWWQAQAKLSEIFNEREQYLDKLYKAARKDMGVVPVGNSSCA